MDKLRDLVMKAADDLKQELKPLQADDNHLQQEINQQINLAENLARLGVRQGLIEQRMATIANKKKLVDAAVSECKPEGQTEDLVTTFFLLVKTLQSECRKAQKDIQEWDEILNAVDFLQKQKQELLKEELSRGQEKGEMQVKDKIRKNLRELAWYVMSEEMMSSRQEKDKAPAGPSTG